IDLLPAAALVPRSKAAPYLGKSLATLAAWAQESSSAGPPAYQPRMGRGREAHYVAADLRLFKQLRAEGKTLRQATTRVRQATVARQLDFGAKFIWRQPATDEAAALESTP